MDGQRFRSDDPFLLNYQPSELRIASEFFTTWLPFLSKDLCCHCSVILSDRIRSIDPEAHGDAPREQFVDDSNASVANNMQSHETCDIHDDSCDTNSLGSWKDGAEASYSGEASGWSEPVTEISVNDVSCEFPLLETPSPRMSWADMAQEDEFGEEEHNKLPANASPSDGTITRVPEKPKLSWEQREYIRFMNVRRKIDYMCFERVNGKLVNILEGLELHTGIFSAAEQKRIVNFVASLQEMGKKGELKDRTYSAPQKWMRGKGRQTIQFGCCYNYATDKDGKPPGILQNVIVDPIPDLFKVIIRRLIRWHVLPPTCVPDSCIVNIYEEGDCIPPHIDNHDFVRPFCTVSFLSECNIVFGSNLKIAGAGEFNGSVAIPLPVGSVLVLNGNGADVAKHCVPAVSSKRISITFRRMDVSKRPIGYVPEPDLQGIQPLAFEEKRSNGSRHNRRRRGRRNDAMGPAIGRDRNLEPHELTQSAQRSSSRQSRGRPGS
ncbi:RNA demethylase ALKBH9B-like isoform X1 [Prosopis cineraria]|uniref:RNA demethylase ALKBH9B-like isoform X1 n=1 Tax=Prosopis cineraria TaxID=364024 RepID=UPI002410109F|nr:RNA demethylase ALKBH9B-like isoform X1 [Prosopis cineraria]